MPLTKNKTAQEAMAPTGLTGVHEGELKASIVSPQQLQDPRPARMSPPMTKDDYWRRREERDIEKDKHIRLSGLLQALLGSVNFGQYCTVASKEAYLEDAKAAALELAKFVTEKA